MNWKKWFKRWGDYVVKARFYECEGDFDIEEMYQMFKARIEAERSSEKASEAKSSAEFLGRLHTGHPDNCPCWDCTRDQLKF